MHPVMPTGRPSLPPSALPRPPAPLATRGRRRAGNWAQEKFKKIKKELGNKVLGEVTVEQALGGMRGIPVSPPAGERARGSGCGVRARRGPRTAGRRQPPVGAGPSCAAGSVGSGAETTASLPASGCTEAPTGRTSFRLCYALAPYDAVSARDKLPCPRHRVLLGPCRPWCGRPPCWTPRRASASAATRSPSSRRSCRWRWRTRPSGEGAARALLV